MPLLAIVSGHPDLSPRKRGTIIIKRLDSRFRGNDSILNIEEIT